MNKLFTRRNALIVLPVIFLIAIVGGAYLLRPTSNADTENDVLIAPSYATNRGAIEEFANSQDFNLVSSNYYDHLNSYYLAYTASDGEATLSPGFIGYLIETKFLQFQFERFTAWGQSCYVRSSDYFFISDGVLMIPVESTSTDPSFIKKCQAMISPAITGYKVIAIQGDGDFKITHQEVIIPFSVIVKE